MNDHPLGIGDRHPWIDPLAAQDIFDPRPDAELRMVGHQAVDPASYPFTAEGRTAYYADVRAAAQFQQMQQMRHMQAMFSDGSDSGQENGGVVQTGENSTLRPATGSVWEYASVVFSLAHRKITKMDPEYLRLPYDYLEKGKRECWSYYWWQKSSYEIWLPDAAEPDHRIAWETDFDEERVTAREIYNELGAEGWEMVSTTGETIRQTAWFKRVTSAE